MTSEARQTANAANALLSTGPRTNEGKARSSQNARQHGLTADHVVIAAEDREDFDELHAQLQSEIRPEGALQQILFDQLVDSAWNLRRIRHMEAELAASAKTYLDILNNPELTVKLDRLASQTRIERAFYRSLREFKLCKQTPHWRVRSQSIHSSRRTEEEYWSGADAEAAALRSALENYERPQTLTAGN